MSQKLWVQHYTTGKPCGPTKVSIKGCSDVDDFLIKLYDSPILAIPSKTPITLYQPDGTTEIDVGDSLALHMDGNSSKNPLVVRTKAEKPAISSSRHYKYSKAIHSSRSYLTSIAVELDQIYPIPDRKSKGKRYVTIGDIFEEAYENNPEPKPQFKNRYQRLNDFFTIPEWDLLEELNNDINPHLHQVQVLPELLGGHKEVILPVEFSHLVLYFQQIAKKSNVVSDHLSLIVKNEGSVSGDSP